jgi:hypothetical protein
MKQVLIIILICIPSFLMAQGGENKENRENRLRSLEIAYLTREVNITPEEAQKFWPVYNKYADEMRSTMKAGENEDVLERQQKMLDIRKKYKPEFTRILSAERTNKLFEAEIRFREMIKKELQQRRALQDGRLNRKQ